MIFRRRTFPEVLDNLLTRLVGGQAAEAHPFPPGAAGPPYRHSLLRAPVDHVVSVYGSRDGEPHQFRAGADYSLEGSAVLEWKPQAELPDSGTLIYVNYAPRASQPVLTDIQTGSVVRTLAESVALETASLYAQLQAVYEAGFIDTATGKSLDHVVALLGVSRIGGGRAAGEIEITRSPASRGTINIPAGTRVMTADGKIQYETVEAATLSVGQNSARVLARDLALNDVLPAGSLTVMPVPVAGIDSVANPAPTAILTQDETDAQLRTRAKNFLHGSERATVGALLQACAEQSVAAEVNEQFPGAVEIIPHVESMTPELQQRLEKALDAVRPAGVQVRLAGVEPPRKVDLQLRLTTASGLLEQDLRAAQRAVREKIKEYFAQLPVKENASLNRLVGLVMSVPQVSDVRLVSARWMEEGLPQDVLDAQAGVLKLKGRATVLGELTIVDPNLPTRLNVVVLHPQGATAPTRADLESALSASLDYLNQINAAELPAGAPPAEQQRRVLSFSKLLHVLPLPGKSGVFLKSYDDQVAQGQAPALPSETTVQPYQVQFVITRQDELSTILAKAADAPFALEPLERLSLSGVVVQQEAGGG